MRGPLIRPQSFAGVGVPGKDRRRPLVVARTQGRVPGSRIGGAVEDRVHVPVVGDPTPHRASTYAPLVARPAGHAQVGRAVGRIEGPEPAADEDILVGAGAVGSPDDLSRGRIQRRDPTPNAKLTATVADIHLVVHHQGSHGHGLALIDLAELDLPELLSGFSVYRYRVHVQGVEKDPSGRVRRTPV